VTQCHGCVAGDEPAEARVEAALAATAAVEDEILAALDGE
jgi:hypothetical protein